eukprot:TRINITY_DN5646_c0_g1_i1.p1 TRINITY_DN5646_c0_g1~~TRINITY_DN5646_c0_g1_i1.p1  ORF type:complete len:638 (+),score=247.17 TRINITY_DN5646_c0_g1_i1:127-2040(+)
MKRKQTDSDLEKKKVVPAKKQKKEEAPKEEEQVQQTSLAFEDDQEGFPGLSKKTILNSKGKPTTLELYIPDASYRPSAAVFTAAEKALFPNTTNTFPEPYKHFLTTYNGGFSGYTPAHIKPEVLSKEEESDEEPEPLSIVYFCALFDVKKGREEDINDEDEDEDEDEEGDEIEDIVKLMKTYKSALPPNLLTVAQIDDGDDDVAFIVINVAKNTPDFGKVSLLTFPPQDEDEEEMEEDENPRSNKKRGASDPKDKDKSEDEIPHTLTHLANNFDEFLTLFMTTAEFNTWKASSVQKKLKSLETAQFEGELKRFVEKWKRKYPLIEQHLRYMCREFVKQQDSIFNNKTGIDPNHILFRVFTFALFFLQKEKHMAATKKKSKKKTKGKKEEAAPEADEISGEGMLDIFDWVITHLVTSNPNAVGLNSFVDMSTLEDVLHYPGAFEDVDPSTEESETKPAAGGEQNSGDEEEEGDLMMNQSLVLKFRISEAKRRRMERVLSREVESDAERNGKWIKESGEVSEEGKGVLKQIFERFDKDADGYLNLEEWNEYLVQSGEKKLNEEEWSGFVELVNFRLAEDLFLAEGEEEGEEGAAEKEKKEGLSLGGWMLVCADSIMMSPDKERAQMESLRLTLIMTYRI